MGALGVIGAKGGVGTSWVAVSLGQLLAGQGSCLLLDSTPLVGCDDLLLDLDVDSSWAELLPVAAELRPRHVDLVAPIHRSGLRLLAAPKRATDADLGELVATLSALADVLVVDGDAGFGGRNQGWVAAVDLVILVTTLDPPALRSAQRMVDSTRSGQVPMGLIVNQWTQGHPADPVSLASSLELPLLGVLPFDPRAAFSRFNFGHQQPATGEDSFAAAMIDASYRIGRRLEAVQESSGRGTAGGT